MNAVPKLLSVVDAGQSDATRMRNLFAGAENCHYKMTPGSKRSANGKLEKNYENYVYRQAVTVEEWQAHLTAEKGLVIVPVREDGTCAFAAIDIDDYELDAAGLRKLADKAGVALLPCRSTSGGGHLYAFFGEPTPAATVRAALNAVASTIGYPNAEIFPKQDRLSGDSNGSPINMPYFGGDQTDRYCVKKGGLAMAVVEFLAAAERSKITLADAERLAVAKPGKAGKVADTLVEAPPATIADAEARLSHLCAQIVGNLAEHADNILTRAAFDIARYCRDTGMARRQAEAELRRAWLMRKGSEPDAESIFDKKFPRHFAAGEAKGQPATGRASGALPPHERVWVTEDGDDTTYRLQIDGKTMEVTAAELLDPVKFNRKALIYIGRAFHIPRNKNLWIDHCNEAISRAEPDPLMGGVSMADQFADTVEDFVTNRHKGENREDLLVGRPWEDEDFGRHYFRLKDLARHLANNSTAFAKASRKELAKRVRGLGGGEETLVLKGKQTRTFWVPAVFRPDPTPDVPPVKGEPV